MLSYHIYPGSGPYLLLVHGALSNRAQWTLNLQALGQVCRPVTAELLGHGDSPAPQDIDAYQPDAYVSYFEAIREALDTRRWFLCGYSLGASLTLRYALDFPDRVIGHALTNSRSAFATPEDSDKWRSDGKKTLQRVAEKGLAYIKKSPFHPRFATSLPKAVYDPLSERAELLDAQGAANTLALTSPAASVRERLAENTRPALLLHGVREKGFAPYAEYAKANMPLLRVTELPAGHGVNMQAADAFNSQVQEFVTECT